MSHSLHLPFLLLMSLGLLHTRTVFEGDIVMEDSPSQGDQSAPLANPDRLWPDGTVPYKFDVAFTNRNRQKIVKDSMAYMTTKVPCVKFENLEETGRSTPDYILIRDGVGCDSQLGRRGGQQVINLNRKCFTDGMQTPVHELMHTIGFLHEMNRPDRDEFIEIHPKNIQPNQENNFQKRNRSSSKYFDTNYDRNTVDTQNTPYDRMSVLHYPPEAFSANGQDVFTFSHDLPGEGWPEPSPQDPLFIIDQVINAYSTHVM